MRFSRRFPAVLVGLILLICSSCTPGGETTDSTASENSEVTVITSEETTAVSSATTSESVEATESTTPEVLIDYIDVRAEVVEYLRDEKRFELEYESVFLLIDEVASVVDADVLDGVVVGPVAGDVPLPVGTILFPINDQIEIITPDLPETLFVLLDGRVVVFEYGVDADEMTRWNGRLLNDLFGGLGNFYRQPGTPPVIDPEIDLQALMKLEYGIQYQTIYLRIDWNGDGITDVFERVWQEGDPYQISHTFFTDGATGIRTDITENFPTGFEGEGFFDLSGFHFLYPNNDGSYWIVDSVENLLMEGYQTYVYSYDPTTIVAWHEPPASGFYNYDEGDFYLVDENRIVGGISDVRIPVTIAVTGMNAKSIDTRIEWMSMVDALRFGNPLTSYYMSAVTDFEAEIMDGGEYAAFTVPAGVSLFPQYYQLDDPLRGYLYFLLADNSQCRVSFSREEVEYNGQPYGPTVFDGVLQYDLFWVFYGG